MEQGSCSDYVAILRLQSDALRTNLLIKLTKDFHFKFLNYRDLYEDAVNQTLRIDLNNFRLHLPIG